MVRYCSVYGCLENTKTNKNRRFFCFPSDELRCKHWIKAAGRMDLKSKGINTLHRSYFVCELHFAESDCYKKFLKGNAVPTLLLPQLEDKSGTSKYTQTDVKLCCPCKSLKTAEIPCTSPLSESTQRKRKLPLELKSDSEKQRLLETITKNGTTTKEPGMTPLLKKIIDTQKVLKHNFKRKKYDQEYIMLILNIYLASPAAYQFFSKILSLPSIRSLERHIAFGISTKFNENIIKCLQSKIRNMSESGKYCIIHADEVPLKRHLHYQINKDQVVGLHEINEKQQKEIATQAFVVMARGIFSNWKQPLAYCFLGQSKNYAELNTWLENIIAKMIEIGFNVCAFTSKQGSNFINMAKKQSVSPDQPFFFVNGRKIYYIFDVPQLMKSVRNNLINYDFIYQDDDGSEQVASWDDIENMYNIEKDKNYRTSFKITESHIKPNNFEKICVKYATQVLSRTVAVTISSLVESGKLHKKCMGTTKFIELINDTFDILNSSTVSHDYKFKKAFIQAEYQIKTLEKAQCILKGLRVINRSNRRDVTNTMIFIICFLTSIKAILSLASDLNAVGYSHLFTRRLNKDPLEDFLGKVRQQCGNRRKPTAIQFVSAFKKFFMVNLIRLSENDNCPEDLNQFLKSIEEAQNRFRSEEKFSLDSIKRTLKVGTSDYRFELPEENAFIYLCGYLLNKVYDHHKDCEVMENYIRRNEQVDDNNLLTYFKVHRADHPFGAYINPPEDFKQYMKQINSICEDHFVNRDFYRVGSEIITKISGIVFNLPCPCFPLEYMKRLFVRFRIFNVMQHNIKNLRDKSFKRKYFSVPHL